MSSQQDIKKIYFVSDFHLGADVDGNSSKERELRICRWLDMIKKDAGIIYLIGDVFDFWFEYKTVVPKGYTRLFGKLVELKDAGIAIEFFIGNHDMWMFSYFEDELDIPIHRKAIQREHHGKKFFIAHGDGLGPGDHKYKVLKRIFANPMCQWLFQKVHPSIGMGIANAWSGSSKEKYKGSEEEHFLGKDKEWLIAYAERKIKTIEPDYFIFGHRHLAIDYTLSNGFSRYINTGEWMKRNSYAVFDGIDVEVKFFENKQGQLDNR